MRLTPNLITTITAVSLGLMLVLSSSCRKDQANTANLGAIHRGVGKLESIDKENGILQIDHEEIKDYMPAMNMPYRVKDPSLLDLAAPGDRVEFSLETTSTGDVVNEINRTDSGKKVP